ncbi:hypothetical protein FO497_14315 [Bacillus cereus ATCC 10876]|uniref:hypothetical protein n=1 Tax=Bacillus TaxID=1386 RepID=UPI0002EEBE38|nr:MULTISPECIES: hypothetical protein [Bacillus]MDJ0280527.1 hypothetical protein [Bacillus bombysepticus]KFL78967.1 hypothetical protein DJ50_5556 [Bacillus cereus ATCC 10876]MBO1132294.1 hypothetical protein [Bacillus cereus]MDJ0294854.1 hypothetical protein [Bacillus bombysepticus]MDJ0300752.1 hypothetical protein [Bacillus bombysepticus]
MINNVIQTNRPLVKADIKNYRGYSLLVTHIYDKGCTVGKVITPMKEVKSIAGKISEVVEKSCEREKPTAYDLHTCNADIYKASLSSLYAKPQMKSKSACEECAVIMHDFAVIAALNDL